MNLTEHRAKLQDQHLKLTYQLGVVAGQLALLDAMETALDPNAPPLEEPPPDAQ